LTQLIIQLNRKETIVNDEEKTNVDEFVSLKALAVSHGRSFNDVVSYFMRRARGAALGVRRAEALELLHQWRLEDAARSAAEQRRAQRAAEERDRRQLINEGRQLLEAVESARFDQLFTEEQIAKESFDERLAVLERRLSLEVDEVAAALDAWSAWRHDHASVALAVEELTKAGVSSVAEPQQFTIPKPDWGAEQAEQRRLDEIERQREMAMLKEQVRRELATERGGA
jgi:hypothetical protein